MSAWRRLLGTGTEIYAWAHEDDSRVLHAYRMGDHLTARVEELRRAPEGDSGDG